MTQPMRLTVGERNSASGTIAQRLVFCGRRVEPPARVANASTSVGVKPPPRVRARASASALKQLVKELSGDGLRLGIARRHVRR